MRCGWIRGRIAGGLCRRFRSLARGGGRFGCGHGMGVWVACGVAYQRGVGWGGNIMDGAPWPVWGFWEGFGTVEWWLSDEYHENHWGGCDGEIGERGVLCVCVWVYI